MLFFVPIQVYNLTTRPVNNYSYW